MTRTSCLLYLYTHSDCRMTRTSCLLYLYTHSDCRMTRTSCLLYLYTHSDCRMTRTSCLLYLYTHSDCRMTRAQFDQSISKPSVEPHQLLSYYCYVVTPYNVLTRFNHACKLGVAGSLNRQLARSKYIYTLLFIPYIQFGMKIN